MCLILLVGTVLCGVLRFIHYINILLSKGPLRAFNFLSFFLPPPPLFVAGGSTGELNYSGPPPTCKASSLPLSCTPRPRTSQCCALHITTKLLQESSAVAITAAKTEFPGLPEISRHRAAPQLEMRTSASRYLPHPLVMLTTVAASSRCNNL